jgi:hypothetical protein
MPNRPHVATMVSRRLRRWLADPESVAAAAAAGGDPSRILDLARCSRHAQSGPTGRVPA